MTRRRWIIIAAVSVIALAAVLFVILSRSAEPRYNGRRLSDWVEDITPTVLRRPGPTAIFWTAPRRVTVRSRTGTVQVQPSGIPAFVSGPFSPTYRYPTQHMAAAEAIR